MSLVLSLFPGIGLLDMAFEQEGFCVVRGPDVLWGGDIRNFHLPAGKFDGLIGGPPCQAFSTLAHMVRANGYEPRFGNLIPEFERCVAEADPRWFLMENVFAAPLPRIASYAIHSFLLDNVWLGEAQQRKRRFSFGLRGSESVDLTRWIRLAALELPRLACTQAVLGDTHAVPVNLGGPGKVKTTVQMPTTIGGHDYAPNTRKTFQTGAVTSSDGGACVRMTRYRFGEACQLQGLPEDFLADAPFTAAAKLKAVANGVPLPMGRAVAGAIKKALEKIS